MVEDAKHGNSVTTTFVGSPHSDLSLHLCLTTWWWR